MLSEGDRAAVVILNAAIDEIANTNPSPYSSGRYIIRMLVHAIRHLAYPDRDVYPKVRGATKGRPVGRKPKPHFRPVETQW